MQYDLLILLLIVGFSYVFKLSHTKNYDSQLIFILLSFITLVIYKYLIYKQLRNSEGYQDFTDKLNEFLNKDIPQGATQSSINEYKSELGKLQEKVDIMTEYLAELKSGNQSSQQESVGGNDMSIQASQQIQDYRINRLRDEIRRTQDIITQADLAKSSTKYNKIKVLSSCLVSNADGTYSADTPSQQPTPTTGSVTGPVATNPITGQPVPTVPQPTQSSLQKADGTFDLSMLQSLLAKPINVNIRS
jgi:hypothetical protein